MEDKSLRTFLANIIVEGLSDKNTNTRLSRGGQTNPTLQNQLMPRALKISDELINEAISSGLPLTNIKTVNKQLSGGNTAEIVAQLTLHAPFVFKFDQSKEKLAMEGKVMRSIRNNADLPKHFRETWPIIYAIRDQEPYAYLMEYFPPEENWISLEDRLYPKKEKQQVSISEATRLINEVLDVMFEGYEASIDTRNLPNIREDYINRISDRLIKTSEFDKRFCSRELIVNGKRVNSWQYYLDLLERNKAYINSISPPFGTITHGDPNPGNLMMRTTNSNVELKLIDPKEWMKGDYLFDIAKITHFLEGTGPIEKPSSTTNSAKVELRENLELVELDYLFDKPEWTALIINSCLDRVKKFANDNGDIYWQERYELGMAANLLGLPEGRLKHKSNPRPEAALILYGEGLKWLARFCERLERTNSKQSNGILIFNKDDLEPIPLRQVRDMVRQSVPSAREAEDRRGFQCIHWEPSRANDQGKPVELSLEHEARLMPISEQALNRFRLALQLNEEQLVGAHLLPFDQQFGDLIVRRHNREFGAQSIDRYYELTGANSGEQLIPRMITLRERLKVSKFMTWSSSNANIRPLNLELPLIALGDKGMTVRLEFNWIDDLNLVLQDLESTESDKALLCQHPLYLAAQSQNIAFSAIKPVLEHSTFREKFTLYLPSGENSLEKPIFDINIDHIVAQSLDTGRIGTYVDVDISPRNRVDETELKRIIEFAEIIASTYELEPAWGTKAWRDAKITGLL